jgi:hypothetical protein
MSNTGNRLTADELATLDYVTGIAPLPPVPDGPPSEDRWLSEQLSDQRLRVQALVIETPPMRLEFADVIDAAHGRRPVNRLIKFWSLGLMMTVAFLTAVLAVLWVERRGSQHAEPATLSAPAETLPPAQPALPY